MTVLDAVSFIAALIVLIPVAKAWYSGLQKFISRQRREFEDTTEAQVTEIVNSNQQLLLLIGFNLSMSFGLIMVLTGGWILLSIYSPLKDYLGAQLIGIACIFGGTINLITAYTLDKASKKIKRQDKPKSKKLDSSKEADMPNLNTAEQKTKVVAPQDEKK